MSNKDTAVEAVAAALTEKATAEKVELAPSIKFYNRANMPPIKGVITEGSKQVIESPIYDDSPANALKRYNGTDSSMFPNNPSLPVYGDFTNFPNVAEASLIVEKAREMFDGLDASVRARFNNDFNKFGKYINSSDFNPEMLMTEEFKNSVYRQKKLNEAYAKQKKEHEDWLLAHPNWQSEQEAEAKAQRYKEFDEYLKAKNLLQG